MKPVILVFSALTTLALMGCDENRYPLSQETCGPNDSVLTLDARDCRIPNV